MLLLDVSVFLILPFIFSNSATAEHTKLPGREHSSRENVARQAASTTNQLMFQGFEWYVQKDEQHWNRLNGQLSKLAGIGVSNLWIPPATKAGAESSTGYDVYDLWDLGEFDQKGHVATSYGTKEQLLNLSDSANAVGISIIADGVMNQRSGADTTRRCTAHQVNPSNRLESTSSSQEIEAWVGFDYAGRAGKYSNKTWGCDDFSGVDYDNVTGTTGVWKIDGQNNGFASDVSTENGNYDYLIMADVAFLNPSVQEEVKSWGSWVTDELNLTGFRLDAAKHISKEFLVNWTSSVLQTTGKHLLFVAEYLSDDVSTLQAFASGFSMPLSVFDTPLQTKFSHFASGSEADLRTVFDGTWLASNANQSVTYVNNHDTQVGQALGSLNVGGFFVPLAYAFILLRDSGLPCVFYGDLYGEFDAEGNFTAPTYGEQIADLALARKYFAYGQLTDFFDDASTVGWTMQGDEDHPEGLAVIMTNAQDGNYNKTMNVGSQHAGETWSSLFGGDGAVTVAEDGTAEFVAGAGTVNVYTRADASQRSEFGSWDISI